MPSRRRRSERRSCLRAPSATALEAQVQRLQAAGAFKTSGVQVVSRATAATASSTRNLAANAVVAGFLGVVLAAVAIIVLARTDKRVRDEEELAAVIGRPVLATVPRVRRAGSDAPSRTPSPTLALSLTLRRLRSRRNGEESSLPTGLLLSSPAGPSHAASSNGRSALVLLLTSPGPGDGTPAVALGLARALGEMGRRAIAIEANLRAPRFAHELGLEPSAGLSGILAGDRSLDEELVELSLRSRGRPPPALPARPALPGCRSRCSPDTG